MSAKLARLEALLGRVQTRAASPRPVQMAAPQANPAMELDAPDLDSPELDAPELDAPDLDSPELGAPELDAPDLDAPELDPPDLDAPEMGAPDSAPADSLDEVEMDDFDEELPDDDAEVEVDEVEMDDLDDFEEDTPQPESGQISSESIDRAISDAEHQPPLTPPPESGEGVTAPQIPRDSGPTMEQLGETIHLEEGGAQHFELDEPILEESAPFSSQGHLEAEISEPLPPAREELRAPENAREDLERVRLGESASIQARVSSRPVLSTNVVELVNSSRSFEPKSFLELLDASLSLK